MKQEALASFKMLFDLITLDRANLIDFDIFMKLTKQHGDTKVPERSC